MINNTLLLFLCLVPLASVDAAETAKPNIVFILADDLGWYTDQTIDRTIQKLTIGINETCAIKIILTKT